MSLVDFIIIILVLGASIHGRELGFVRQLFSSGGFFIGLYLGALLQPYLVIHASNPLTHLLITVGITLGCGLILLVAGEYLGIYFKKKIDKWRINPADDLLGPVAGAISILFLVWLNAAILINFPSPELQNNIRDSTIITKLNNI